MKKAIETPPPGMSGVKLQFQDEFSPSHAEAYTSDPDAMHNPSARHIFYNQQLYGLLAEAIQMSVELGFAPVDYGFPLTFPPIRGSELGEMFRLANGLSAYLPEGSMLWLCVQCYIRHALLCNVLTEPGRRGINQLPGEPDECFAIRQRGADSMAVINSAFYLGAAIRELELALLNKKDALRGKMTKKAAKAGGEMRKNMTSPETDARRAEMMRLIEAGQSIASAARITAKKVGGTVEANRALLKPGRRK